jgi:hypothetical protein
MIVMDNNNPKGVSIGPASTIPKRLAAAIGGEAAIKRSTRKKNDLNRFRRVEKRATK